MTAILSDPKLRIVRLPGEDGPILRCSGELTLATEEILQRELALVLPAGRPVLTVNLSDCSFVDVDGILTLLGIYKELRRTGSRLAVVTGIGRVARLLHFMGIERVIPLFPTEGVAARALRGGAPPDTAPATWETAREQTVARWRTIQALLEHELPEEALRLLTTMAPICLRSEELFQERAIPVTIRCQFCPVFYELGGQGADAGCRSVLDPILEAVQDGDTASAREQVAEMIRILEEMPVTEQTEAPVAWLPTALGDPVIQ